MIFRVIGVLVLLALPVRAEVTVGFVELRRWDGSLRRLEPDFDYAHVALQWGERWLHAHPKNGVEVIHPDTLEKFGKVGLTVTLSALQSPEEEAFQKYLGRPYDEKFSWGDEAIYCSELVAKVLGIKPEKMHFDPKLWPPDYLKLEGLPGISPGGLYRALARQIQRQNPPSTR